MEHLNTTTHFNKCSNLMSKEQQLHAFKLTSKLAALQIHTSQLKNSMQVHQHNPFLWVLYHAIQFKMMIAQTETSKYSQAPFKGRKTRWEPMDFLQLLLLQYINIITNSDIANLGHTRVHANFQYQSTFVNHELSGKNA